MSSFSVDGSERDSEPKEDRTHSGPGSAAGMPVPHKKLPTWYRPEHRASVPSDKLGCQ
jgi:hypothetical protein